MAEKAFRTLKFKPNNTKEFGITLRKRVNEYFKTKDIDRTGGLPHLDQSNRNAFDVYCSVSFHRYK